MKLCCVLPHLWLLEPQASSTLTVAGWLLQMKCVRDKDYVPNFKTAFEHFLVHTGGRAVIEEVEKKLRLDPADVQPSKETLYRYGNTCCAAVFYVLTNMESRVGTCSTHPRCMLPSTAPHPHALLSYGFYVACERWSLSSAPEFQSRL